LSKIEHELEQNGKLSIIETETSPSSLYSPFFRAGLRKKGF
jgi:hypothetical protein